MCDNEGNKHHIHIFDHLLDFSQHHQHFHLEEKKKVLWHTNSKTICLKENCNLFENLGINSLACFSTKST